MNADGWSDLLRECNHLACDLENDDRDVQDLGADLRREIAELVYVAHGKRWQVTLTCLGAADISDS